MRPAHELSSVPWRWSGLSDQAHVRSDLEEFGISRFHLAGSSKSALTDGRSLVEMVLGESPLSVEVSTIRHNEELAFRRPCFLNTRTSVPLHTDGHFTEMPMKYIVMACVRPASTGGMCLVQDGWSLVSTLSSQDRRLYEKLFRERRRMQFITRTRVYNLPTISQQEGSAMLVHPAFVLESDVVGREMQALVNQSPVLRFSPVRDEIFVLNNWRMLHGRDSFDDDGREFIRLWPHGLSPCKAPESFLNFAYGC